MKKDWSISLLPSGSTRLNLNDRLPPFCPFSWMNCSRPAEEEEEEEEEERPAGVNKQAFTCPRRIILLNTYQYLWAGV